MANPSSPRSVLSPRRRFTLWLAYLAALTIVDFTLITLVLAGDPGAGERDPFVALAYDQGALTVTILKLLAFEVLLVLTFAIDPAIFTKTTERAIIGWCILLLVLNAWTTLQLIGVV